jgi:hypothetical protein
LEPHLALLIHRELTTDQDEVGYFLSTLLTSSDTFHMHPESFVCRQQHPLFSQIADVDRHYFLFQS